MLSRTSWELAAHRLAKVAVEARIWALEISGGFESHEAFELFIGHKPCLASSKYIYADFSQRGGMTRLTGLHDVFGLTLLVTICQFQYSGPAKV